MNTAAPTSRADRFRAMVERFPDRAEPRFSLARALQDAGDHAAAQAHYAAAQALQPDLMMAWLHQAECLVELGRWQEAHAAASRAHELAIAQGHSVPRLDAEQLIADIDDELG